MEFKFESPELINKALTPLAESIGETLNSLWNIVFGNIDFYSKKVNAKRAIQLEAFKNDLIQKISNIPKDNLQEPKLNIVGPALESSKYYFEESEIRSLFSKLIASSMDKTLSNSIRVSFTEFIKQLEPLDARLLKFIYEKEVIPKVNYMLQFKNMSFIHALYNFFENFYIFSPPINYDKFKLMDNINSSLINLQRLGLINIEHNRELTTFSYDWAEKTEFWELLKKHPAASDDNFDKREYEKGFISLSNLGKDFAKVCF
jgi:hypothetical protein|nr:MAG TPA: protein of unknown function (DUF4393) [Caudoviricetes sp.]